MNNLTSVEKISNLHWHIYSDVEGALFSLENKIKKERREQWQDVIWTSIHMLSLTI